MVDYPILNEIEMAVGKLKNNRASGHDILLAELLKHGGKTVNAYLHLFHMAWIKGIIPEEWNTGIICPIYKKGNKLDCNNYRGMTLLSTCLLYTSRCV